MKPLKLLSSFPILIIALSLNACKHDKPKFSNSSKTTEVKVDTATKAKYAEVKTWLDDFKNFRTAVYQKDVEKMKTYFNFPVLSDTTQIWEAIYDNVDDSKRPKEFPSKFTEKDFEEQHQKLFDIAFMKSLLKVKSEVLYKTGEYTTPEIKDGNQTFSMLAHYDKATSMLQLSVLHPGGTDENGERVSEGEWAAIYFFKVENNKTLKFDKILFAG